MLRKLRLEYPGAIYHVMNRGDQRDDIFPDDADRERFLFTLGEACVKTDWQVHAYCLMRNHYRALERGWCLGSEEFRQELLAAAVERVGISHYGADRQETGEQKAQRIVLEEMKRLRWEETDLRQRRKGDVGKVNTARRLRQETPVSLKWIAQRLHMGTWTYVFNLLRAKPPCCVNSED